MGFTPATGQEISMGCVYEAFGLAPFPGANIGLNSTLGVNRQPPQAVGVSAIPLNSETELSVDMGGLDTIDEYCDIPTPTNTPTNTTTPTNTPTNTPTPTPTPSSTPSGCNVYEYINTTQNTTFSFGPYPLCPGPGDFDIQIVPGAEGVTSCIEQLSQATIDAFNAQGLVLTGGECPQPPLPVTGLIWALTVNNPCNASPWVVSNRNLKIRYNITNSVNCGGTCSALQAGTATATITVGAIDVNMGLSFQGIGELQQPNFEKITFSLDGVQIARANAAGGFLGCQMGPVVQTFTQAPPYLLLANSVHTLFIDFTTNDELFHVGSFYEVDLTFVEIP